MQAPQVVVVGGGLAGLAAATYLARAGRSVRLVEKADTLGGRARTRVLKGFHLNLGAHALYRRGPAAAVFKELGIALQGGRPLASGGVALLAGGRHTLPSDPVSLLSTGLLPLLMRARSERPSKTPGTP